jgi:hypothetical protein
MTDSLWGKRDLSDSRTFRGERMDLARASILSYLRERADRSTSRRLCGGRVQNDLEMSSLDCATTLAMDTLDELASDGLVDLFVRGDGLEMVRLAEPGEGPIDRPAESPAE